MIRNCYVSELIASLLQQFILIQIYILTSWQQYVAISHKNWSWKHVLTLLIEPDTIISLWFHVFSLRSVQKCSSDLWNPIINRIKESLIRKVVLSDKWETRRNVYISNDVKSIKIFAKFLNSIDLLHSDLSTKTSLMTSIGFKMRTENTNIFPLIVNFYPKLTEGLNW